MSKPPRTAQTIHLLETLQAACYPSSSSAGVDGRRRITRTEARLPYGLKSVPVYIPSRRPPPSLSIVRQSVRPTVRRCVNEMTDQHRRTSAATVWWWLVSAKPTKSTVTTKARRTFLSLLHTVTKPRAAITVDLQKVGFLATPLSIVISFIENYCFPI